MGIFRTRAERRAAQEKEIKQDLDKYYQKYNGEVKPEKPDSKFMGFLRNITRSGTNMLVATILGAVGSIIGFDLLTSWNGHDPAIVDIAGRVVLTIIAILFGAKAANNRQEDSI